MLSKILKREEVTVETSWGAVKAKKIMRPDGGSFIQPEFESCKKIASEKNVPLKDVYTAVTSVNEN